MLENKETPDRVCQQLGVCKNPECHIFPLPTKRNEVRREYENPVKERIEFNLKDLPVADHRPLVDFDSDGFSTIFGLRGYAWRGKDCNDFAGGIHPGRMAYKLGDLPNIDYNCNGIKGVNPDTSLSYEQDYCHNTGQMGVAILGDSAGAHFAIPPAYFTPAAITTATFKDLLNILENEIDWPDVSATTGYHQNTYVGNPGPFKTSFYMKNVQQNRCAMRDFQNIAVNGARSGSMADKIVQTLSRDPLNDSPLLVNLALIGNDVCNGHHDFSSMTTPADMYNNTMRTLRFLDTQRLPKGSKVIMTGLADGRILYEGLADRIHPIGTPRNDVTYAQLYTYLNCMNASPCWGWMNTNATVRNTTAIRQRELNNVLATIASTERFNNFETLYIGDPIAAIAQKWVAQGGQIYELIEAADGFHPSQLANGLIADYVWDLLQTTAPSWIPAVNPNNAKIQQIFGDQGGFN